MRARRLQTAALSVAAVCLALGVATAAVEREPTAYSDGRYLMGTVLEVTLVDGDASDAEALFARVGDLEARISSWQPHSDVSRLSDAAGLGPIPIHAEVARLLGACVGYSRLTHGAFDVTVGPLVDLWRDAAERGRRPHPLDLERARSRVGAQGIRIDAHTLTGELPRPGMRLDLGGVAKGAATDTLAAMLEAQGIGAALIDFGGSSLHAHGAPPGAPGWRVLLSDAAGGFTGILTLRDRALSVSSSAGRSFEIDGVRYGPVVDPRSGEALRSGRVAAVVATSGELAEALTKALLVLDADEGLSLVESLPDVEGVIVDATGARRATSGFDAAVRFEPIRGQEPRVATDASAAS